MPATTPPEGPLANQVDRASAVAQTIIREPEVVSVLVDVDSATGAIRSVHCGFQRERRRWLGGRVVDLCWVRADKPPVVTSSGTYGREQYRRLAKVKEFPFPLRPLDLSPLAIEPVEVLRRLQPPGCRAFLAGGLALGDYAGELAWTTHLDEAGVGMRTVIMSARDGRMLFQKFDAYNPRDQR